MGRRALLIGSQTGGLTGVHADVEAMADTLQGLGFSVGTPITRAAATYDGIVAAYEGLIEDASDGDAVVVYYSGHGGHTPSLGRDTAPEPGDPASLRYLVPTDIDDLTGDRFRGLLAEELSLLQWRLTEKTANVVTILDCCHASRMSRSPDLRPKAVEHVVWWPSVRDRWAALRNDPRAATMATPGNPNAARLVAAAEHESAYELRSPTLGAVHGALTAALLPILRDPQALTLTWRQVGDLVRSAVREQVPNQRPEMEGAAADRLLFSLTARTVTGVLPLRVEGGAAYLDGASLLGIAQNDVYALVAPGAAPDQSTVTATVVRIAEGRARLRVDGAAVADLAAGTEAFPVAVSLGARPIAVIPIDHARRPDVLAAVASSPFVEVVDGATEVLATVRLDGGATLLDSVGEPLRSAPHPLTESGLDFLADDLRTLARANRVRDLASGTGAEELADDVEVAYVRLTTAGETPLDPGGEHLFPGDRIVLRFTNRGHEQRYVSVLDVGLTGALWPMTEPTWLSLGPGAAVVVGETGAGALEGIELFWPDDLPEGGPRPETYVSIVANEPVTGVDRLSQPGVRGTRASAATTLDRLLDDVGTGRRDGRRPERPPQAVRYRVHRLDVFLHPAPRPSEDDADEPSFEIDERPHASFRQVVPRSATPPPSHVTVRLAELTVHSNRALLKANVRVDTLVVSAPPVRGPSGGGQEPFLARTFRIDRVKKGDTLPLDDVVLYDGPVDGFLEVAVWVARDDSKGKDLTELLHSELAGEDAQQAIALLAGLAVAAPPAALIAGATAAVAVLIRTGARLLDSAVNKSIGVYITSFLPHQMFGTGGGIGRHPGAGVRRSQDMSFAFEVVDPARADQT